MSKIETSVPQVHTFGCRLNAYESQVIAGHLRATGLDCLVINSCAVTAEAERQVRQRLRQVRRKHPTARIVMTGCAATLNPRDYAELEAVDAVVINAEKLQRAPWQALAERWGVTSLPSQNDEGVAATPTIGADRPNALLLTAGVPTAGALNAGAEGGSAHRETAVGADTPNALLLNAVAPVEGKLAEGGFAHRDTTIGVDTPNALLPTAGALTAGVRVSLEIQQGCNHRCTFCIIPYARGDSVSISVAEVVRRLRRRVAGGTQEVTFTGVDIASWGAEWGLGLPHLVREVLRQVPELPRLYLSSLDPTALDDDFFALWASESRLQPRLHLSIQAGDDLILKRMRRRHSVQQLRQGIAKLRQIRSGVALGADLIAGFPTESPEAFQRGYDLVAELEIPFLHVFPYSPRPGTPAALMPQVPRAQVLERAGRLRALGTGLACGYRRSLDGQRREILFESKSRGRTPEGVLVESPSQATIGQLTSRLLRTADQGARLVAI